MSGVTLTRFLRRVGGGGKVTRILGKNEKNHCLGLLGRVFFEMISHTGVPLTRFYQEKEGGRDIGAILVTRIQALHLVTWNEKFLEAGAPLTRFV